MFFFDSIPGAEYKISFLNYPTSFPSAGEHKDILAGPLMGIVLFMQGGPQTKARIPDKPLIYTDTNKYSSLNHHAICLLPQHTELRQLCSQEAN